MEHEAYFIWDNGVLRRASEGNYSEWVCSYRISDDVPDFGIKTTQASFNIFAQYDGYVDYYEEGMEVAPFVLHFIKDVRNDPGNREGDLLERFTSLKALMDRRNELIKSIAAF